MLILTFFETRYILSTVFVPGDRHVLAGLKNGTLLIIDIAAGDVLEEIPAHKEELWSICLQPDLVVIKRHSIVFIIADIFLERLRNRRRRQDS